MQNLKRDFRMRLLGNEVPFQHSKTGGVLLLGARYWTTEYQAPNA